MKIAAGAHTRSNQASTMENLTETDCFPAPANELASPPSLPSGTGCEISTTIWRTARRTASLSLLIAAFFSVGCGQDTPPEKPAAEVKPASRAVPEEVQGAADSLLGKETTVLLFGELAKNGKQQFLAANVVPKTPKNNLPGTIVTRAVVAENTDGKWAEVLRCDEHLKNQKGFLGMTPLAPVTGWRLQYEQSEMKGLELYFTPLQGTTDSHVLPIGVRWNPETKRYQSLDRTYEHFLLESPSIHDARSTLR